MNTVLMLALAATIVIIARLRERDRRLIRDLRIEVRVESGAARELALELGAVYERGARPSIFAEARIADAREHQARCARE